MAPLTVLHFIRIAGFFNIADTERQDMMGDMEQSPDATIERSPERNLLKDPGETIRAMALIEGPAWLNQQTEAERKVFEEHITEPRAIMDTVPQTVIAALTRLRNMESDELAEEPHTVHTIYGTYGVNRYFVQSDGTVSFSAFHKASDEHLAKAKELGFEIFK